MAKQRDTETRMSGSQTLSRGLQVLEILAESTTPLTIAQLAEELGVHRSNAYRILRTLDDHRYVHRSKDGTVRLGSKLAILARAVSPALQTAANGPVTDLAYKLGMTAFVTILDRQEVVTVLTVEPSNVLATVSRNPAVRHPLLHGAPGHAIEATLTGKELSKLLGTSEHTPAAAHVLEHGYSLSDGEVIPGVQSLAVPLRIDDEPPAALAIVHFSLPENKTEIIDALTQTAARIRENYR